MTPDQLREIKTRWLAPCGACDGGLPMSCTHPDADYRNPMSDLVAEVERLRDQIGAVLQLCDATEYQVCADWDTNRWADAVRTVDVRQVLS